MEATRNHLAIILNRQAYRERDSLVNVYTADAGKLSLIARGTQQLSSKLAGHIEPLTLADIMVVRGKGLDYIGSAIGRETYFGIRADLNKLYYAGRALSIFNSLVKGSQTDENLFLLLTNWLEAINSYLDQEDKPNYFDKEKGEVRLIFFILKLLDILGYKPEMYQCLTCSQALTPGNNHFDLLNGGLVCADCLAKGRESERLVNNNLLTISDNCVKIIRFIISNNFDSLEKLKVSKKLLKEASFLVNNFVSFCS